MKVYAEILSKLKDAKKLIDSIPEDLLEEVSKEYDISNLTNEVIDGIIEEINIIEKFCQETNNFLKRSW